MRKRKICKKIESLQGKKFISASCGNQHSCGLTSNGKIITWGRCFYHKNKISEEENKKTRDSAINNKDSK